MNSCMRGLVIILVLAAVIAGGAHAGQSDDRVVPAPRTITVALDVQDTVFPENQGRWRLRLEDRSARIERAGDESAAEISIRLEIEALARLYNGALTPTAAR